MKLLPRSRKTAVTLTYIGIVAQAVSTMVLTRFYLKELGTDTYGLYQMINAVAQYILILDLGISTVMIRYISEFDARENHKEAENFAFHFGMVVLGIVVLVLILGVAVNRNIENIYRNLTPEEYVVSHRMFRFIMAQLAFTVLGHYFQGISLAYEQYTFEKTVSLCKIILNFGLVILLIKSGLGVVGIVAANMAVIAGHTVISALYDCFAIRFRIRFHHWNLAILRPAGLLMLAMLLQAVVGHVNNSVDKTILGIMATKRDVAVYAVAATFITMFNTLPTAISTVFQAEAVRLVTKGSDSETLTSFVIKSGRLQFMVLCGFFGGFVLFGKDFIVCWTNESMLDAWKYVIIIMLPNAVPLVQNTCLAILNAMDKRLYRSLILAAITVLNIAMTVVLVHWIGPVGAPLATGIAYLIGHVILMNIYYAKRIGLNIPRMFRQIVRGSWLCGAASIVLCLPVMLWRDDGNWLVVIVKAIIFCAVYGGLLLKLGMNEREKQMVRGAMARLHLNRFLRGV